MNAVGAVVAQEKVSVSVESVEPVVSVDGPKRKPFLNRKQTVNTDAGQWKVKIVDGKRVFVPV